MPTHEPRNLADDSEAQDLCPECGREAFSTENELVTFPYGVGQHAVELTAVVPVRRCNHCGFEFFDDEAENIQHEAVCEHLGVLNPREIRDLREKAGLSRKQFAGLTRIGEASIARWERGALVQNRALDSLIRLLAYPENVQRLLHPTSLEAAGQQVMEAGSVLERFGSLRNEAEAEAEQKAFQLRPAA